jgi:hypothetical protein
MVVRNSLFSAMCVAGLLGVALVAPAHAGADLTIPNKDLVVGPGIVTFTGTANVTGPDRFNAESVIVVTNPGTFPALIPGSGADLLPKATANAMTPTLNLASFDFTGFADGVYSATIGYFDNLHTIASGQSAASVSITVTIVPEPGVVAFGVLAAGSVLGLIARKRKA